MLLLTNSAWLFPPITSPYTPLCTGNPTQNVKPAGMEGQRIVGIMLSFTAPSGVWTVRAGVK